MANIGLKEISEGIVATCIGLYCYVMGTTKVDKDDYNKDKENFNKELAEGREQFAVIEYQLKTINEKLDELKQRER